MKRYISESKLDGLRGVIHPKDGQYAAFSRNGKEMYNCGRVFQKLQEIGLGYGYVLDGEFLARDGNNDWNLSMSITKTQSVHPKADRLQYWVFDIIPIEDWDAGDCKLTLLERKELLNRLIPNDDVVVRVIGQQIRSHSEALEANLVHVAEGFEGSVIKDLESYYTWADHGSDWMKWKPLETGDYPIVEVQEGAGRLEGSVGALWVETEDGRRCKVGTGFSDADRNQLWELHQNGKLIGMIVEVLYQGKTFDESGALRFAKYVRLREDKEVLC